MIRRPRKRKQTWKFDVALAAISLGAIPPGSAEDVPPLHMRLAPEPVLLKRDSSALVERVVTNNCTDTIYPAITTQSGNTPEMSGFRLDPGNSVTLHIPPDWQGRVWGRTNCTFPNPSA